MPWTDGDIPKTDGGIEVDNGDVREKADGGRAIVEDGSNANVDGPAVTGNTL